MEISTIESKKPDLVIRLSHEEASELHSMLFEARSYASGCGEVTDKHMAFINLLTDALNL